MQKEKVFLAPFQAPALKVLYYEKWSWREKERRSKQKEAKIQNSRKSRSCCAKLLQLFLFLLAVSFGFTFSATVVHMGRKAYSTAQPHHGGRTEDQSKEGGEGRELERL